MAIGDVEVHFDGDPVDLRAGGTWAASVSAPTEIELPGLLRARVVPGTAAADSRARLEAAQAILMAALAKAQVADVATARLLDERRRELIASREKRNATFEALAGDDVVDELRTRLGELRESEPAERGLWDNGAADPAAARADLDAAVAAHKQAMADCETHRKVAEAAAKRLGDRATRAKVAREKRSVAQKEAVAVHERLTVQRSRSRISYARGCAAPSAGRSPARCRRQPAHWCETCPRSLAASCREAARRLEHRHCLRGCRYPIRRQQPGSRRRGH